VWDLDMMGVPSKLSVRRKTSSSARARPTLLLNCWGKTARRKWNWPLVDWGTWTPGERDQLQLFLPHFIGDAIIMPLYFIGDAIIIIISKIFN
jgi:hypothetical protein